MYVLEMKNSFPRFISKLDTAKERIRKLEYRLIEMMQSQSQRERRSEENISESIRTIMNPLTWVYLESRRTRNRK